MVLKCEAIAFLRCNIDHKQAISLTWQHIDYGWESCELQTELNIVVSSLWWSCICHQDCSLLDNVCVFHYVALTLVSSYP